MLKPAKGKNKSSVRAVFEPLYHRSLSDEEVCEIESNLKSFGRAVLKAAGLIEEQSAAK